MRPLSTVKEMTILRLFSIFIINREKTNVEPDTEKLHVENKNNTEASVPDMMDGLAVELYTAEDNGYETD